MADAYESAKGHRGWLETLSEKIPGYAGYADRERRRDADRVVREHVAGILDHVKDDLDTARLLLTDQTRLEQVGAIDRVGKRVESLADRLRTATYGYAGLFDAQKIGDAELARLYEFDGGLEADAQAMMPLCAGVLEAVQGKGEMTAATGAIDAALRAFETKTNDRARAITG